MNVEVYKYEHNTAILVDIPAEKSSSGTAGAGSAGLDFFSICWHSMIKVVE